MQPEKGDWDDKPAIKLANKVKNPNTGFYIITAGAGIQALEWLFREPGTSTVLAEAAVPNSRRAVNQILGVQQLDQYVSCGTAIELAKRARELCLGLTADEPPKNILGIACTAAIRTFPERRGTDRIHVACYNGKSGKTYSVQLIKNAHKRWQQELIASSIILNALASEMKAKPLLKIELRDNEAVTEGEF